MEKQWKLIISLCDEEKCALDKLAETKSQLPGETAANLIREGLLNYGLLHWVPTADQMTLKVFETGEGL